MVAGGDAGPSVTTSQHTTFGLGRLTWEAQAVASAGPLPPGAARHPRRFGSAPLGDSAGIARPPAPVRESGSLPGDGEPPAHAVPVAIDPTACP